MLLDEDLNNGDCLQLWRRQMSDLVANHLTALETAEGREEVS